MKNTAISKAAAALGRVSSPAKTAAARENGKQGGRPVKTAKIGAGGYTVRVTPAPTGRGWGVHVPTRSGQGDTTYHAFRTHSAAVAFAEQLPDFAGWRD